MMKKNAKRFFSTLLALVMLLSMVPMTAFATENGHEHEVDTTVVTNTAEETTATAEDAAEQEEISFNFGSLAPALLNADETEVDEGNPAIIALETELKEVKVLLADGTTGALTEEQVQTILGMYQQYLDHWEENANILGVQTPFFLSYNDNKDGLGILGEMLVLDGKSVDDLRNGVVTYDDITGMITTFLFADQFGVQLYGQAVKSARDEVLSQVDASGAKTDVQKYMVINNWLAQNVTFDMEYIMNTDKEPGEEPMVAENPQEHEYYDIVYDAVYDAYEPQIVETFENNIRTGLEAEFKYQYYVGALQSVLTEMYTAGAITEAAAAEAVVKAVKDAYWTEVYNAKVEELSGSEIYQDAYDARYNEYLDANCEHEFVAVFDFSEDGTVVTADVTCSICDRAHKDVNAAVTSKVVDATCTEAKKNVSVATVTVGTFTATEEKVVSTEGEPAGHQFGADGKCSVCGAEDANHVHDYAEEVTTAATCTEEGEKTLTCACGDVQTEKIDATGHTEVALEAVEPTCTETGLTAGEECSVCGTVLTAQTVVDAKGHSFADGACSVCGETDPDAHVHSYTATTTTAATCGDEGLMTYTCDCSHTYTEVIPATGNHVDNYGDGVCDVCVQNIPLTAENDPETLASTEAGDKIIADADAVAKVAGENAVKEAAEEAADAALAALTDEEIQAMAEEAIKSDADTMAQISAGVESEVNALLAENDEAIKADPVAFVDGMELMQTQVPVTDENGNYILGEDGNPVMMTIAAQLHAGWETFWADAQENGVEVDPTNAPGYKMTVEEIVVQQMDTPQEDPMLQKYDENGNPIEGEYMTPNEAVPVFAAQAAVGIAEGVLNYWQGSHFGALGRGTAVCLGYTKAFAYLVQCLQSDIYTGGKDINTASNWKNAEELYYTNGELDISKNYAVDCVRITFDADVTMYGETQENFNSDHFWNAVQVDGKWYYVDPCYVDVYTEVMIRDRVETDGSNNYLYFMFSHDTTVNLYDGYYSDIKTLYDTAATHTDYEDSWISRIKSNFYAADGYFYYVYDSTDMVSLMDEFENSNENTNMDDLQLSNSDMKLVAHKLDTTDAGTDGDTDYETLIEFNYAEDEDSDETVARVKDTTGALVENEMLTELYAQYEAERESYPSLAITCALYNGKVYFNLSNCLLAYDLSTCEVSLVKEYNVVHAVRDDTNPFGGMAFSTVSSASSADFTVENHPIAGISLKDDGNLYVSIATNFAFISGKDPHNSADQGSYGYEFEETNYNSSYNSYTNSQYDSSEYEQMGYEQEVNDNDEFMWSANFVEILSMSHLAGSSHSYTEVSVDASCGHNAYTENRCSNCGAIEADTRVEEADTAHEHHFLRFDETYYTKDDNENWNTGFCYVCTECLYAVEEPTEPDPDQDYESAGTTYEEQLAIYEEEKAIYDAAAASAGHDYVAVDATWSEDHNTATFKKVECSANCLTAKLDCLVGDETITKTFSTAATISGAEMLGYTGDCTEGAYCHYRIVGETNGVTVTAETAVQLAPGEHGYTGTFTWTEATDAEGNVIYMDNGYAQYTASAVLTCGICGDTFTDESADVTVEVTEPTIEARGMVKYTAKAIATDENGTQIGTLSEVMEISLVATPEAKFTNIADSGKPRVQWGAVDGAAAYNVYRSTDGENYTLLKTVTGTKLNNTSAVVGQTYYYYVTAVSEDGMESAAEANVVSGICKIARTTVTLSNVAKTGKIKISWEAVEGAVNYEIYRSEDGGETYQLLSTAKADKTSITNTSAVAGVQYRYKIKVIAENPEANSAFSSAKYRTCDLPRPDVTLSNVAKSGKIKISWEAVEGAVKYEIHRSTDGGETYTKLTTTTKTSVTNTSAEAGETYYYKVKAIAENTDANSAFSSAKYRTCDLERPDVTVKRNSKGKPVLTWDEVDGAVKYRVYVATSEDGEFEQLKTTTGTKLTHGSAKAGTTYYYKVRAIAESSSANSADSVVDSIKAK